MLTLGLSAFYHDSAAALLDDGVLVAAAQQERFSRKKHDAGFPIDAVAYCLGEVGARPDDLDFVAFYDKPVRKFQRLLATHLATAPGGFETFRRAMPVWIGGKLFQRQLIDGALRDVGATRRLGKRLLFAEHHESHAASAFYPSPFEEAAILTIDGVGEWATTSLGFGSGSTVEIQREMRFPHSLGLLYAAFTAHLGFKVNSGEYKVMGLAPYGEPRYFNQIMDEVVDYRSDGSFRLDMSFFDFLVGSSMTSDRFAMSFGPARHPDDELMQNHLDLAASVQLVTEELVLRIVREAHASVGVPDLCMAGGVALNCVANGRVLREGPFDRIWIQPAAGDAGGAVGAAYLAHHCFARRPRPTPMVPDAMSGSLLGPGFGDDEVERVLTAAGAVFERLDDVELRDRAVDALESGLAVGWFQGRMEFGPRALGARSILADPRSAEMQRSLNLRVKFRESFRPFAPSVLHEEVASWFDLDDDSPYMLLVADVAERRLLGMSAEDMQRTGLDQIYATRSVIPAVTHVDGSARVQIVDRATNPRYHALLEAWHERTGCAVLVNTSFNVRGEPIVATPQDALDCFLGTDIDMLVIENCLLDKTAQTMAPRPDHRHSFELD